MVYVWSESDYLKGFTFDETYRKFLSKSPKLRSARKAPKERPGGILSLSASGTTEGSGIVWASLPLKNDAFVHIVPGVLRAFVATTLEEIWNSERDSELNFAKYCPPTVANGKVYLATFSESN